MQSIKKVAILGSGVMGSAIACHMANVGLDVVLLDIPFKSDDQENVKSKNEIVNKALKTAVKSKPAPLYSKKYASRIVTGNFEENFDQIKSCDWVIEVVIEDLEIKKSIFEKVEIHRKKGSFVSSNTSGIPINMMLEGRSDDFKMHFLGTHFFNPPRYLKLLEIIPTDETSPEVVDFFMNFGRDRLGKETILCKDTPAFIANRIGVFAMAKIFELAERYNLDISTVDKLTGPSLSRPKTGTFRLGDLVGMDTAVKVINGIQYSCPNDKMAQDIKMPKGIDYLLKHKFFGNKSGQGFYKKTRDENGKSKILQLDLESLEYIEKPKSNLKSLELSKQIEDPKKRIQSIINLDDDGAKLIKDSLAALFSYSAKRFPEISDNLYGIDDALKAGFAWSYGPYEYWDIVGLEKGIELISEHGYSCPNWVIEMKNAGRSQFYTYKEGSKYVFNPQIGDYTLIPGQEYKINLAQSAEDKIVFKNDEVVLHDIGDQVLCLEFKSKMNTIGEGVLKGMNKAIDIAEEGDWRGLVIGNQAENFSVGANLMMIAMLAYQGEFDELNFAVDYFQKTTMRMRYSSIPVVMSTQGYVFGGACETLMHCDGAVAAAESYIGLVEVGVGLIPGGGGTKEFALRLSDSFFEGDVQIPSLISRFKTIALGQVATSAVEAFDMGFLIEHKDEVIFKGDRNILQAKAKVIALSSNYHAMNPRQDIKVLGQQGLASLYTAINELVKGRYASEHDVKIAQKLAFVLCGGDLSGQQTVSEQYLLDVEREAFLSLCGEQKTLERIQYMLQNNKPLRN